MGKSRGRESFKAWWTRSSRCAGSAFALSPSPTTTSIRSRSPICAWLASRDNTAKVEELTAIRNERLQLMEELAKLPKDMVFFTQMTMEAGEDGSYLDAMRKANIKGALVGVEAVTPEGLKAVYKDWNYSGEALAKQLQTFKAHGVHVLGSFIFGLPTDRPCDLRRHGRDGHKGGRHLCSIRDDDAVSRHGGFWPLGKGTGRRIPPWWAMCRSRATG